MTEDDIAVFKSQPNDIPYDLHLVSIRQSQTRRKQVYRDDSSMFSFSFEEEDPKMRKSQRKERQKPENRGISLSTFEEAAEDQDNLEDRLSPKFEKL